MNNYLFDVYPWTGLTSEEGSSTLEGSHLKSVTNKTQWHEVCA